VSDRSNVTAPLAKALAVIVGKFPDTQIQNAFECLLVALAQNNDSETGFASPRRWQLCQATFLIGKLRVLLTIC
jgi:hypothetical protein